MKQSSLDDPGLGMEYEGGEPANNSTTNEDGEIIVYYPPPDWNQTYYENNQLRPNSPQLMKGKGNMYFPLS